jgi:hypothetical protein
MGERFPVRLVASGPRSLITTEDMCPSTIERLRNFPSTRRRQRDGFDGATLGSPEGHSALARSRPSVPVLLARLAPMMQSISSRMHTKTV